MEKIAPALVAAQKAFESARKSSKNPHFKSNYAALDVCVDAVRDALNNNGIFLSQPCHECSDGVIVETLFIHESGQTFSAGKLHVPAAKQDPQGYGSALTYARRYSLLSSCGIAPEDDDGNAAAAEPARGSYPRSQHQHSVGQQKEESPAAKIYKEFGMKMSAAKTVDELDKIYLQVDDSDIPQEGKEKLKDVYQKCNASLAEEVFK